MKVAIIGSAVSSYEILISVNKLIVPNCKKIISSGSPGVGLMAKKIARAKKIKYKCVHPDYKKLGRIAPLINNCNMINESDYAIILWDGKAKIPLHAVTCCIKWSKPFQLLIINKKDKIFTKEKI